MSERDHRGFRNDDETIPLGKRTGREGTSPGVQPGEFADDIEPNRFRSSEAEEQTSDDPDRRD
jgi:hypothetical protein